tara:strand:+ start:400 stop:507 length:108 start_codon:yes stop_codon:yes gene_type:complete
MADIFTLEDLSVKIPSQKEDDPTNLKQGEDDGETE